VLSAKEDGRGLRTGAAEDYGEVFERFREEVIFQMSLKGEKNSTM
jgi:hypothetical protein